jgi:hypothetical protein
MLAEQLFRATSILNHRIIAKDRRAPPPRLADRRRPALPRAARGHGNAEPIDSALARARSEARAAEADISG